MPRKKKAENPWKQYVWTKAKAGRRKGQLEPLDSTWGLTQTWLKRGWIELADGEEPEPEPDPDPPAEAEPDSEEKGLDEPPVDRAIHSGPVKK